MSQYTRCHDTAERRVALHLQTLTAVIAALQEEQDWIPSDPETFRQLDEADTAISLLRARVRMKSSTVELCSQFGKTP